MVDKESAGRTRYLGENTMSERKKFVILFVIFAISVGLVIFVRENIGQGQPDNVIVNTLDVSGE